MRIIMLFISLIISIINSTKSKRTANFIRHIDGIEIINGIANVILTGFKDFFFNTFTLVQRLIFVTNEKYIIYYKIQQS